MSNTDGEDTLRIEKEAIAFADSIEVNSIATHTGLVKGYIAGAKELASIREQLAGAEQQIKSLNEIIENLMNDEKDDMINLREQLAKKDEDAIQAIDALTKQIAELMHQLKQKEDENRELKDDYKDLVNSIQRLFQTLIARQYNNIGVWSNERQDYNHQLINELEELLKTHNTRKNLSA